MPDSIAGAADRSAVLQLTDRVSTLEAELAALRREVDVLGFEVRFCKLVLGKGKCKWSSNTTTSILARVPVVGAAIAAFAPAGQAYVLLWFGI